MRIIEILQFLSTIYIAVFTSMSSGWELLSNSSLTLKAAKDFQHWTSNHSATTWMLFHPNTTELWSYNFISGHWGKSSSPIPPLGTVNTTSTLCGIKDISLVLLTSDGATQYFLFNTSKWHVEHGQKHPVHVVTWWCSDAHLRVLTHENLLWTLNIASKDWHNVTITAPRVSTTALINSYRWSKSSNGSDILYALTQEHYWSLDTNSSSWTVLGTKLPTIAPFHSATCLDSNDNFWIFNLNNARRGWVFHSKTTEWSTVDVPPVPQNQAGDMPFWCINNHIFILLSNLCHHSQCYHVTVWSMGLNDMRSSTVSRSQLNNSQSLVLKANCDKDTDKVDVPPKQEDSSNLEEDDLQLDYTSSNSTVLRSYLELLNSTEQLSNESIYLTPEAEIIKTPAFVGRGSQVISGHGRSTTRMGIGTALSRPETYGSLIFFGLSLSVFTIFGIVLFFRRCVSCPPRNSVLLKETPPVRYTEITDESFAA